MGNSCSSSAPNPGPELSSDEKKASANSGNDSWLKGLESRTDPARKAIIDALCPSVFASTSMDVTFDELAAQLLRICNSDTERLKRMLQTPFLDGQNPVEWTINNLPIDLLSSPSLATLPPVLSILTDRCGAWDAFPYMVTTIHGACCKRGANGLFQLLNPYSRSIYSATPVYTLEQRGVSVPTEFEFAIRDFPARMLLDGRIDLRFVCKFRLYSVGFLVGKNNQWMFLYSVVQDHAGIRGRCPRTIHLDLFKKDEFRVTRDVINAPITSWNTYEKADISAGMLQNANLFVSTNRVLKGFIRISHQP